ncbi:MAG TPA: NADH-ubiquinone oxidoreductase-F iron-sulfur binding region domain-containing protein [Solirubrobacteraceae bacterium]|nr:NADH-ubiquinone oxidoreductase-F iron-sulfur binding region domain-containing protein [Solirubrobacteraceae bacterium]
MSNVGLVADRFADRGAAERRLADGGEDAGQAPALLPRLLRGLHGQGQMSLEEHLSVHGQVATARARRRRQESPLIATVEQAGLRGCGGAGFPTATKLRAVAGARGRAIVVVNAAEGEPASRKDRTLMELLPHLVLDGAELAAQAVGADEIIVCVCETVPASQQSAVTAIDERRRHAGARVRTHLSLVPGHYVAGQESALVNYLGGGAAVPTFTPPLPFERGVRRRPTLVSNAETLAHLALIARHGPEWFRQLGTPSQPGSALVTLSGPVSQPGVYEIEHGASLTSLVDAAGGITSPPRALLVGGYGGSWIGGELLPGVVLSDEHLAAHGATLGAGVLALLSADACAVAETARVARWLADQSSGQCGPCVYGLDAIATGVEELASGVRTGAAAQRVTRLAGLVRRRGACGHPDGAARFVTSALETFAPEFSEHAHNGPCEACTRYSELPLPSPTPARARGRARAGGARARDSR